MSDAPTNQFFRPYDLTRVRARGGTRREFAAHQNEALYSLGRWYDGGASSAGGILTLPTGGGKTVTAVRFLCTGPLSDGYKVLWLAHTHHLLEQAIDSFGPLEMAAGAPAPQIAAIAEPRDTLNVRVVSGTPGHSRVHTIKPTDDVLVITLQTATRAYQERHPALRGFLDSAGGKLVVVFDEAHHAPAPSFSRFLTDLRAECPSMRLLGLTATPTYSDERRQGWLKRLFPQGIVYQVLATRLMADGVLARPRFEDHRTDVVPEFDARSYDRWVAAFGDLPEEVIEQLARNQVRNDRIVETYVRHRERYGRTIIFADRWFQCDYLREKLLLRGARADVVYSHVDADPGSVAARNARTSDENGRVLRAFRAGELDVLINVRMLTEGTDVPQVQTVFLTRQTTSRVLLTQMVGRALRGPKFGGTEEAYIVTFTDSWQQAINWAEFEQPVEGRADDGAPEYGKRPPLQLISIELVRRLVRQMEGRRTVDTTPFLTLLPVGWYRVEYDASVAGTDDTESVRQLVMVFEDERPRYDRFLASLTDAAVAPFGAVDVTLDAHRAALEAWQVEFFADGLAGPGGDVVGSLFQLVRHVAQSRGDLPRFFTFDERREHDLDAMAEQFVAEDLGPRALDQALCAQYGRPDRYWRALYGTYHLFQSQYLSAQSRVLDAQRHGGAPPVSGPILVPGVREALPGREPSEEVKRAVIRRDGRRCLCCGSVNRLQVDHVAPSYLGGTNDMHNLQTLCSVCNRDKRISEINFRVNSTSLTRPPAFALVTPPRVEEARDVDAWERYLRRTFNFFYRCAAVDHVMIGRRGPGYYHWQVQLFTGNNDDWVEPYLFSVLEAIEHVRRAARVEGPNELTVVPVE